MPSGPAGGHVVFDGGDGGLYNEGMDFRGGTIVQLESIIWKSGQPIAEHYMRQFERVRELFEYDPAARQLWRERAAWLDEGASPRADRRQLADALRRYNESIGNDAAALEQVQALQSGEALAVVGGQQAGLFTGQLLVIYKAITIVQAARQASERLGRPVVPVFWIAGEDHDWDEVDHIQVLTNQNGIEKLRLAKDAALRTSVSRTPVTPEEWEHILGQLDAVLMDTEYKSDWMRMLRGFAAESRTLTDLFARMLAKLFGRYGLVLMDSDDPALRRVETGLFERLIVENETLCKALLSGQSRVRELGYPVQAEVGDNAANLFLFEQGERTLLHREGDLFVNRRGSVRLTKEQLLQRLRTSPESFSNNVMTRPLMQEYLFPVLATVLGPGEIAYWALLRQGFAAMGMKQPPIVPRIEATLLEGTVQKHMRKYELTVEDVAERFEERKRDWLKAQDTLRLEERFAEVKRQFRAAYEPLLELIGGLNPGLRKLGDVNLSKINEQIDYMLAKATDAQNSKFEAALRQLERIRLSVLPLGKPQERVYNVLAYLNRYGDGWLHELAQTSLALDGRHLIVYL
jgi:bacillithiol biosynthesis cysteine-adding enzyme BshC